MYAANALRLMWCVAVFSTGSNATLAAVSAGTGIPSVAVPGQALISAPTGACDPSGICLQVTVSTDLNPSACGSTASIEVTLGSQVNFCYLVTNNASTAFNYHTLSDDSTDPPQEHFVSQPIELGAGASYQYNRIVRIDAPSKQIAATWTATSELPTYTYDDTEPFDFVDITTTGTRVGNGGGLAFVELPFPINFYGSPSRRAFVSLGGINMEGPYGVPQDIPFPMGWVGSGLAPAIVPYGTVLDSGPGGVYEQTLGDAPNRRFVIEWYDLAYAYPGSDSSGGATFEAIFTEGSDAILFEYQSTAFGDGAVDNGAAATVGINYGVEIESDGTQHAYGTQYSYNEPSLHDGMAIRWTPSPVTSSQSIRSLNLDVGTPTIALDRTVFVETAAPGTKVTDTLTISNSGNRNLNYAVDATVALGAKPWPQPSGAAALPAYTMLSYVYPATFTGPVYLGSFDPTSAGVVLPAGSPVPPSLGLAFPKFVGSDFTTLYGFCGDLLVKLDTTIGSITVIGNMGLFANDNPNASIGGAAYDPVTGLYYVVFNRQIFQGSNARLLSSLYTLDLTTAIPTYVGDVTFSASANATQFVDIAINAEGEIYAFEGTTGSLVAIDPVTAQATTVGLMDFYPASLGFDQRNGTLYALSQEPGTAIYDVYTIDTNTAGEVYQGTQQPPTDGATYFSLMGGMALATSSEPCVDPVGIDWLSADPATGSIDPANSQAVTLTFDAGTLPPGVYTANVCVNSNDPARRYIAVPVTLTVGSVNTIFVDGFDGTTP
jgi:hypothetical protein